MSNKDSDQASEQSAKITTSKETQSRPARPSSTPQGRIDSIWKNFPSTHLGRVTQILQYNSQAKFRAKQELEQLDSARPLLESYNIVRDRCIAEVDEIINECRQRNIRYRDQQFDIEADLKDNHGADCLYALSYQRKPTDRGKAPRSVKRIHEIFDNPRFYVEESKESKESKYPDIRQGTGRHCWILAALGSLGGEKGKQLISNICVHKDEQVGVYGFVFHRDGAWEHTIIDDKLYLIHSDFHESVIEKQEWSRLQFRDDSEEEYRRTWQVGSRALYFASCSNSDATWLPLMEKALAKAHGDYSSLDDGYTGEATEDLTGGVTTELRTSDILDTDEFWNKLLLVNKEYVFGCSTGRLDDWQILDKWQRLDKLQRLDKWQRLERWQNLGNGSDRMGIQRAHAYSIMDAREIEKKDGKLERLLLLRNPWGKTEWTGRWSDGSSEWTDEMKELLNHESADDGIFWMEYSDWRKKFDFLDRTRLFDESWYITQQWTSIQVPWSGVDFHETKFTFTLNERGPAVVVLSQLDERYWRGLEGQYGFTLHFRINEARTNDCVAYSHGNYSMRRSVNAELDDLPVGTYNVYIKVTAFRDKSIPTIDKVLMKHFEQGRTKLMKTALSYDMAHARGLVQDHEEERKRHAESMDENPSMERSSVVKRFKRKELEIEQTLREPKKRPASRKAHRNPKITQGTTKDFDSGLMPQFLAVTPPSEDGNRGLRRRDKGKSSSSEVSHTNPTPSTITESVQSWKSDIGQDLDQDSSTDKHDYNTYRDFKYHESSVEVVDEDLAELTTDPWNAVCVVGLRIFTKTDATKLVVKSSLDGEDDVGMSQPRTSGHAFSSYGDYTYDDDGAPAFDQNTVYLVSRDVINGFPRICQEDQSINNQH